MTDPSKELLDRNLLPELVIILEEFARTLERCTDFGTNIIVWGNQTITGDGFARGTLLLLGRHAIELLDGLSILIRHSGTQAGKPLVRSLFEAFMAVEYMAAADTEQRALAYQASYAHAKIAQYERLSAKTDSGKQLRGTLARDKDVPNFDLTRIPADPAKLKANLNHMLAKPEFAPIEAEWQRMRSKKKGAIPWFSLFDGPSKLEDMAIKMGHVAIYEFIYRSYSGSTHAEDVLRFAVHDEGGEVAILALRQPFEAQQLCCICIGITLKLYRILIRALVPEKEVEFSRWYVTHLRERYLAICGSPLINQI